MNSKSVIIVEDDRSMNDWLTAVACGLGDVSVEQAFSQDEAERKIRVTDFHVAILDIDLGRDPKNRTNYGGMALLPSLAHKGTVAVVISGMPDENLHELALTLKAYDFLAKPVNEAQVANALQHALDASERTPGRTQQEPATGWPADLHPDPRFEASFLYRGKQVRLSLTEYRVLRRILDSKEPVPGERLVEVLGTADSKTAVATHISNIRKRFRDINSQFSSLKNRPGRGYYWQAD